MHFNKDSHKFTVASVTALRCHDGVEGCYSTLVNNVKMLQMCFHFGNVTVMAYFYFLVRLRERFWMFQQDQSLQILQPSVQSTGGICKTNTTTR